VVQDKAFEVENVEKENDLGQKMIELEEK